MGKRTIAFDKDKYPSVEEMFDDISVMTQILIKNEYEVLLRYEDCGIYVLEYCDSRDSRLGGDRFTTVTEDEYEVLQDYRYQHSDDPDE